MTEARGDRSGARTRSGSSSGHWGRRQRRLRRTATVLVLLAVAGGLVGWWLYERSRPETRKPGEELPEITRKLDRGLPEAAPLPRMVDVTAEAGLAGFETYAGPRTSQLPEDMGPGVAWGDYDGDGDDDLFLVSVGGPLGTPAADLLPSLLYENRGDGTFRRVADFPEIRIHGMGAAWGDADGDGRLDLVVTGYDALRLFLQRDSGFEQAPLPVEEEGFWGGAAWGDADNDRDLDLYVSGYVRYEPPAPGEQRTSEQYGTAVPFTLNPASYEPHRNLLFENRGDGTFRELAEARGVANVAGRSLTALWHDFDADGRLDLYVANDISDNALYLNRGERFEDAGLSAFVADYRGAMGLAAGDWNRDGDDDLFVTHWVAQENALYDSLLLDIEQRSGEARRLGFTDVAAPRGLGQIALRFVGWGTELADFDGDGWLDIVIANGSTFETDDDPPQLVKQVPHLLWNEEGRYYHDLAQLDEELFFPRVGRGLALSDYDLDGDLDLLISSLDRGVQLLRNEMQAGNWLELALRSRRGDVFGDGEGSTVEVRIGDLLLRRSVTTASYLSQSSRILHFGLGEAQAIDRLEVRWLGGEVEAYEGVSVNGRWELTEGEPTPRRLDADSGASSEASSEASSGAAGLDERQRLVEFWAEHRAGMDAFKREADLHKAIGHFRRALELDPEHEDARYYLANSLAEVGEPEEALEHLDVLRTQNPQSHRGHKQWGVLKAMTAEGEGDLVAATEALERALELNQEETGSLLVLGELALLRGRPQEAEQYLEHACQTNPNAVGGFFLRGYIAWKEGRQEESRELLHTAREALGEDWKPEGTVAEGDVEQTMHVEETPLSRYWETWDGGKDPSSAFASLDAGLR